MPTIEVPYDPLLTPSTFTISMWIKPDAVNTRGLLLLAGGSGSSTGLGILTSATNQGSIRVQYGRWNSAFF